MAGFILNCRGAKGPEFGESNGRLWPPLLSPMPHTGGPRGLRAMLLRRVECAARQTTSRRGDVPGL